MKNLFRRKRKKAIQDAIGKANSLPLREKFSEVYSKNLFAGKESISGQGSSIEQTHTIREKIPDLIKKYNIASIVDAPCGDWNWFKDIEFRVNSYIGIDIVKELIYDNNYKHQTDKIKFICEDITKYICQTADVIICRDCLVHLSFYDSINVINNFKKSGSKFLLITNFTDRYHNIDLEGSFWRVINLRIPPFNFPEPLEIINENCTEGEGRYMDKTLCFWKLEDIKIL